MPRHWSCWGVTSVGNPTNYDWWICKPSLAHYLAPEQAHHACTNRLCPSLYHQGDQLRWSSTYATEENSDPLLSITLLETSVRSIPQINSVISRTLPIRDMKDIGNRLQPPQGAVFLLGWVDHFSDIEFRRLPSRLPPGISCVGLYGWRWTFGMGLSSYEASQSHEGPLISKTVLEDDFSVTLYQLPVLPSTL